jgi:hypothetical protein
LNWDCSGFLLFFVDEEHEKCTDVDAEEVVEDLERLVSEEVAQDRLQVGLIFLELN